MPPIDNDGANMNAAMDEDQAVEAFLRQLDDAPKKEPSDKREETDTTTDEDAPEHEDADEADEHDAPSDDDGDEGEEEEDDKPARKYAEDEGIYVKIKVGDEEQEVAVKDLKRLFGQEAALTKRSQEVADRRKQIDTEAAKYLAQTQALLTRAQERAKPYMELDFLALSRNPNISDEELTALRREAQSAMEDVQFLTSETENFMREIEQRQFNSLRETAAQAIKELSDPVKGLPGWSEKLYDDIRAHAIAAGAPQDVVSRLVDPWAIRLIHDAMMFKRGKSKVVTDKVNKVNKGPKRVVKTSTNPSVTKASQSTKASKALNRLRMTGSADDATDAFLASLESSD
jgi:hypothetical protein